jgi:hypothetical protein
MSWRALPGSTRFMFWAGLVAAAVALLIAVLVFVGASRIG